MAISKELTQSLKIVGWQVAGGLMFLVNGAVMLSHDSARVLLKKEESDMFWQGFSMCFLGCAIIGLAAHSIAKALLMMLEKE